MTSSAVFSLTYLRFQSGFRLTAPWPPNGMYLVSGLYFGLCMRYIVIKYLDYIFGECFYEMHTIVHTTEDDAGHTSLYTMHARFAFKLEKSW